MKDVHGTILYLKLVYDATIKYHVPRYMMDWPQVLATPDR